MGLLRLPVTSLALATTALRIQLRILVAIRLRRLGSMIDMTGGPLLPMTDTVVTLLLPLRGLGHHLEGGLHRAGKNLRDHHPGL